MSDEIKETTETTTVELKPKIETVQLSARMLKDDKAFILEYISGYEKQYQGFNALVEHLKTPSPHTPIEQKETIETIETVKDVPPVSDNAFLLELTPQLKEKLTVLRRFLKNKGDIPAESTELEFLQRFTAAAYQDFINRKYSFLNK